SSSRRSQCVPEGTEEAATKGDESLSVPAHEVRGDGPRHLDQGAVERPRRTVGRVLEDQLHRPLDARSVEQAVVGALDGIRGHGMAPGGEASHRELAGGEVGGASIGRSPDRLMAAGDQGVAGEPLGDTELEGEDALVVPDGDGLSPPGHLAHEAQVLVVQRRTLDEIAERAPQGRVRRAPEAVDRLGREGAGGDGHGGSSQSRMMARARKKAAATSEAIPGREIVPRSDAERMFAARPIAEKVAATRKEIRARVGTAVTPQT